MGWRIWDITESGKTSKLKSCVLRESFLGRGVDLYYWYYVEAQRNIIRILVLQVRKTNFDQYSLKTLQ